MIRDYNDPSLYPLFDDPKEVCDSCGEFSRKLSCEYLCPYCQEKMEEERMEGEAA